MIKIALLIAGWLTLLVGGGSAQEVVVSGFPLGVGGSIEPDFLHPYHQALQAIADSLRLHPGARAIITGSADGVEFDEHHDAKNPGLALGRAHLLRNVLVYDFGVDSTQITIESQETYEVGDEYRFASVRLIPETNDLSARVAALENRPPVEKHFTEVREVPASFIESFGLQAGAGLSTTPFGAVPIVAGAITWKRVLYVEGMFGHTMWDNSYRFMNVELDTWRRLAAGLAVYRPVDNLPVGVVGGWIRIEEISQRYYDYVSMSEGPLLGLRATPFEFASVTALYNPSKHRVAESNFSESKNGQFLISILVHYCLGGGK
ncbi:MAG: hypothetical protein AB1772_08640 [Candidatus Zixiibacteriota bacterium]